MPPKTMSSHQRMEPAPRQSKIARQTTLVHRRTSPPKLNKRDSTLTQLGFFHPSSPAVETQWRIPVTSDAEDEDGDYSEPRSKKRRKTSASKAKAAKPGKKAKKDVSESQSTLTQNWRATGIAMDSYDTSDDEDLMMVDERMQPPPSAQPKQTRPLPRRRPAPNAGETQMQGDNLLGAYLDNGWSSESELETASKSSLTHSQLAYFMESPAKDSTRPTTANSNAAPKTPKRITKTEIPDSAETASVVASSQSTTFGPRHARSPLKERSTNVPSQRGSSQAAMRVVQDKDSLSQAQLDDAATLKAPVGQWSAELAFTPKRAQKMYTQPLEGQQPDSSPTPSHSTRRTIRTNGGTARMRTFERVSTIAESDDSDVELGDSGQPRCGSVSRSTDRSANVNHTKMLSQRQASKSPNAANVQETETAPLSAALNADTYSLPLPADDGEMQVDGEVAGRRAEDSPSLSQDDAMPDDDPATDYAPQSGDTDVPVDPTYPENRVDVAGSIPPADKDSLNGVPVTIDARSAKDRGTGEAIVIDDSEADEEFTEDDDYTEDDLDGYPHERDDYDDEEQEYSYQQTYDPVADALARDGARAWRTETQLQRDELDRAQEQEALVEESDEEIAEGLLGDDNIVAVPSSQNEVARVPSSQDFADPGQKLAALGSPGRTTSGDIDDSGYASQEMLEDESTKILPQPMPPPEKPQQLLPDLTQPSQVSTIGDTQCSRSCQNSAHSVPQPWTAEFVPSSPLEVDVGLPEDPIQQSPQNSYSRTLSSSPFPMPPGVTRRERKDYDTQSSGLMDFSLPPPPPLLLSSSRPREGCSSR